MVLSAIKQSENGSQQIIRLYNTSDDTTSFALNYCKEITALHRCNLDETPKETLSFMKHQTQTICVAPNFIYHHKTASPLIIIAELASNQGACLYIYKIFSNSCFTIIKDKLLLRLLIEFLT